MCTRWIAAFLLAFIVLGFAASFASAQGPESLPPSPPPSASSSTTVLAPAVSEPIAPSLSGHVAAQGSSALAPIPVPPAPAAASSSAPVNVGAVGTQASNLSRHVYRNAPCPPSRVEQVGGLSTDTDTDGVHLRYELERIEIRGNERTRERVVLRYVKLRPGDIVDIDDPELELMRYRLLGTGFFQAVNLSLRKGTKQGEVVLVIDVVERNTIIVSGLWMGLSADADTRGNARPLTAYAGADVAETNLAGMGITLGGGMGFSQDQLALRTRFFDPSFLGTQWMATASLLYNNALEFYGNDDVLYDDPSNAAEQLPDYAVVRYQRFGGRVGAGRDLSVPLQAWIDYRLERIEATLPLAASHRRGRETEPIEFGLNSGLSLLSTIRTTLQYDTRDSPILATRGSHTTLAAEVSLTPFGSDYPYQKYTLSTSRWFELPWQHVVRLALFGGAIVGRAPIYERFYVGDFSDFLPNRMLGLNMDSRPPPNFLGTSIVEIRYGTYAAEALSEYRIPLYRGSAAVYGVDLFGAAGAYTVASERDLTDPPSNFSGLARVPIDLTFNLGLQIDTNAGGFTFAFSNVLGFIPVRNEAD